MQNSFKYSAEVVTTSAPGFKLEFAGARINGVSFQFPTVWAKNGKLIQKSYFDIAKSVYNILSVSGMKDIKVKVKGTTPINENPSLKNYVLGIQFCYTLPDDMEDLTFNSGFVFRRYIPENVLFETVNIGFSPTVFKCPTPEPGAAMYPAGPIPKPVPFELSPLDK